MRLYFRSKANSNYLEAFFIFVAAITVPRAATPVVARTATATVLLSPVLGGLSSVVGELPSVAALAEVEIARAAAIVVRATKKVFLSFMIEHPP